MSEFDIATQRNTNSNSSPIPTLEESTVSNNHVNGLTGLPHDLLETMITNIGVSVADLSRKHVVLLVFLRYFGCVFCQRSIVDIVNSLSSLIKLNCVPVFVHQETAEEAEEFFSMAGMPKPLSNQQVFDSKQDSNKSQTIEPNKDQVIKRGELMSKFLRVADPEGNYYYKQFGVKTSNASDMSNNLKVVIETVKMAITQGYKLTNYVADRASRTQLSATFVIANGKIVNRYLNDKVYVVPDFMEVLLDLEEKGSDDLFDLLRDQSEYVNTASEMSSMSSESQTSSSETTISEFQKIVENVKPIYEPVLKSEKKKKSNSCFSAQIEEVSNQDLSQQFPLQKILADKHYRKIMKLFSTKIYAAESLMFWEEAHSYQKVQNETKRKALAKKIINSYLSTNSPTELNVSSNVRESILERYNSEGSVVHLFSELIKNIESDSLQDIYVRFLDSDLFRERILKK